MYAKPNLAAIRSPCLATAWFPIKSFYLRGAESVSWFVATCTSIAIRLSLKKNKSKTTPHLLVFCEPFLPRVFNWVTVLAVLLVILLWILWKPKTPSNRWHTGQLMTLELLRYLASYMNGTNSLPFCLCYHTAVFINALKNGEKKNKIRSLFPPTPHTLTRKPYVSGD